MANDPLKGMSRIAAALTAAIFSISAFASDGATHVKPRVKRNGSKVKFKTERLTAAEPATFTGVVFEDGDPLSGVNVALQDDVTMHQFIAVTDAKGSFAFTALKDGVYHVEMTRAGFRPAVVEHLVLKQGAIMRARVSLRSNVVGESFTVACAHPDPTQTDTGVTTVFSQELINKLPH